MYKANTQRNFFMALYSLVCGALGALTVSIRSSYLWDLGFKRQLLITIVFAFVFGLVYFGLLKWVNKWIDSFLKSNKIILLALLFGISLSISLLTFRYPAWQHTLEISPVDNEKEVQVLQITTPGITNLPLDQYQSNGDWKKVGNVIVAEGIDSGKLVYQFRSRSDENIVVLFATGPNEGRVEINLDGHLQTNDLYEAIGGETIISTRIDLSLPIGIRYGMRAIDIGAIAALSLLLYFLVIAIWDKSTYFLTKDKNGVFLVASAKKLGLNANTFAFRLISFCLFNKSTSLPMWSVFLILILVLTTVISAAFSDVFRGAFLLFLFYFLMGIGPALLLLAKDGRAWFAFAIAPVLGLCIVTIIGSLLVTLNLTVSVWAQPFLWISGLISGIISIYFVRKIPQIFSRLDRKETATLFIVYAFTFVFAILPVAIGGLKLSALRGNPDDANNYMGMALILKNVPLSTAGSVNVGALFNLNPIYPRAFKILSEERWASSAVLAWASLVTGIPIYRFDFAFAASFLVLLVGPVFALARSLKLSHFFSALVSLSICLGFYAQLVLDIRALSEINSFPILILLTLMIINILQGSRHWGEYILVALLTASLMFVYPEIFPTTGLGILLFFSYCLIRRRVGIKKTIGLATSAISGVAIAWLSQPTLFHFFFGQVSFSIRSRVEWERAFFDWLNLDSFAGVLGLSPYQFNSAFLQVFLSIIGFILICIFIIIIINTFRQNIASLSRIMFACLSVSGMIIFSYFSLTNQYWQADKGFTFVYPFLMLMLAAGIQEIFLPKDLIKPDISLTSKIAKGFIVFWFVSQAALGIYRVINSGIGFDYPYYIAIGKNTPDIYSTKYAWDTKPYQTIFGNRTPTVWTSAFYQVEEFLDLALEKDAKLIPTSLISGVTPLLDTVQLPTEAPDYLLVTRNQLPFIDERLKQYVVNENQSLVLFQPPFNNLDTPLVVGVSSYSRGEIAILMVGENYDLYGLIVDNGYMEFYSPRQGNVTISADFFRSNGDQPPLDPIQIISYPGSKSQELHVAENPVTIEIVAQPGLNIIKFSGSPFVIRLITIQ
jgi:hypothetical protein